MNQQDTFKMHFQVTATPMKITRKRCQAYLEICLENTFAATQSFTDGTRRYTRAAGFHDFSDSDTCSYYSDSTGFHASPYCSKN